ncbi:2-hydroxychromene-2-carboxylate isomerase [Schlegelella aquatica]|uniref:2-hydroxychromene-2-carboxylate isomerase n=1 Tax=Caldimonas aquatica TaxID=376175 RepID=UPI003753396C
MKRITFYFDVVSPYCWLAFERLPVALQGISHEVEYQPVLFGAMLKRHGQLGPAEIAPKRAWTYRHVLWLARRHGLTLRLPAAHPFNPLPLLRLALACGEPGTLPNRHVCETLFRHVWTTGDNADDPQRLEALAQALAPRRDPQGEDVKTELRAATEDAVRRGVFGVPTFAVDDRLFWGFDALDMLRACLQGDPWFDSEDWHAAARWPRGASRREG